MADIASSGASAPGTNDMTASSGADTGAKFDAAVSQTKDDKTQNSGATDKGATDKGAAGGAGDGKGTGPGSSLPVDENGKRIFPEDPNGWNPYNINYNDLLPGDKKIGGVDARQNVNLTADPNAPINLEQQEKANIQITNDWASFKENYVTDKGAVDLSGQPIAGGALRIIYDGDASKVPEFGADGKVTDDYKSTTNVVSEGQGYGMLLSVYMQDQKTFDGISNYVQAHVGPTDQAGNNVDQGKVDQFRAEHPTGGTDVKANDKLMGFKVSADGSYDRGFNDQHPGFAEYGYSSATDGDIDIAHAYLMADRVWGSNDASHPNYGQLGRDMVSAIKARDINNGPVANDLSGPNYRYGTDDPITVDLDRTGSGRANLAVLGGDKAATDLLNPAGPTINVNPSYFAPGAFRDFGTATGDSAYWNNVINANYEINKRGEGASFDGAGNSRGPDGLVAQNHDAVNGNPGVGGANYYQSDAFRSPFREAEDLLWNGNLGQGQIAKDNGNFLAGEYNPNWTYSNNGLAKANAENPGNVDPNKPNPDFFAPNPNYRVESSGAGEKRSLDGKLLNENPQYENAQFDATAATTALLRNDLNVSQGYYRTLASDHGLQDNGVLRDNTYFNAAWKVFGELAATGNLPDLYQHPELVKPQS